MKFVFNYIHVFYYLYLKFLDQSYDDAITLYTKAIELNPTAIYFANRSFAYLKTECFGYALTDASKAIELDKNYVKGYYRRAAANMSLGKFKLALKDYETVTKAKPSDKDAKMKYTECNKIIKKLAFEKAIAVQDEKSIADSIDLAAMSKLFLFLFYNRNHFCQFKKKNVFVVVILAIEDQYTGPKLENDKVTEKFMLDLMQWYKEQKLLHRKYAYTIIFQAKDFFTSQPSLIHINVPDDRNFTICGDIHGQYYDLLNIFKINGLPSETNPYVSFLMIFLVLILL